MTSQELTKKIGTFLLEKKASDVMSINISEKSIVADYYVLATAKSSPHVKALSEYLEEELDKYGISAVRREGTREGRWAVIDFGDVVVHIFNDETRLFYSLEKLWGDGKNIEKFVDEE